MPLSAFPRVSLAHTPTPLEKMENLSRHLGGPTLYIKRDDCTGLGTGGNKTRKLEFLMADAIAKKADCVVTVGATQSNHVRQTAAACAKLGLECHVILEQAVSDPDEDYATSGNVLLDKLFGAIIHHHPKSDNINIVTQKFADKLTANGRRPYFIPVGGSNEIGSLGYAACGLELSGQMHQQDIAAAAIFHATGSQGTQAGLLVGLALANDATRVIGITVSKPREIQEADVLAMTERVASFAGVAEPITADRIECDGDFVGAGYGVPTPGMIEAVELTARHEGILLDPVYSGKAMAGMISYIRSGAFSSDDTLVFIHTGGTTGLFAYKKIFEK